MIVEWYVVSNHVPMFARLITTLIAKPWVDVIRSFPATSELVATCDEMLRGWNGVTRTTLGASEGTNRRLSLGAVGGERTTKKITHLPEGLRGALVETVGTSSTWSLELSLPLTASEGDAMFSSFVPGRPDSPEWECGREDGEGEVW